jgi:hypothetical protein
MVSLSTVWVNGLSGNRGAVPHSGVDMPTFGADPEDNDMGWTDTAPANRYVSKPVRELTNYFAYHRHMSMSQRCSDADKSMLNIFFSRRLKQGFSADILKDVIDRFYQSSAGQVEIPAPLFCTNDVQNELMSDADVTKDDEVLQWFLDGMPNDGLFSDTREMRKAVILYCEDALLRYPEVVADILRTDDPEPHTSDRLAALEELVAWNLGTHDVDTGQLQETLASISLPKELASRGRSPKSIRKRHETVKQAIVAIPIRRSKEKW